MAHGGGSAPRTETIEGELDSLVAGKSTGVAFPGQKLEEECHRKLGDLQPTQVPADAEALYEATCFAADNNALEVRALQRSGPSRIPQAGLGSDRMGPAPVRRR